MYRAATDTCPFSSIGDSGGLRGMKVAAVRASQGKLASADRKKAVNNLKGQET